MSADVGFTLSWLRLTGPSVPLAQIIFKPGLNVIWGASDTGKSFIFGCINYLLGGDEPPKPVVELAGYSSAFLALTQRDGQRRLFERGLQGGEIRSYTAEGDAWSLSEPDTLRAKHDSSRTDTISYMLLSTIGMQDAQILRTKAGKTRSLSFRDIVHLTLINEERIIAEESPVYPTKQWTKATEELSTFSLLISGNDWQGVIPAPDVNLEKAAWRGKSEVYEELIDDLSHQLSSSSPSLQELSNQIDKIDTAIANITSTIDDSANAVAALMNERRLVWESSQKAQSRLLVVEQLRERFELLRQHYQSDIERLKFISEGDFLLSQLGAAHCPYCGELLDEHSESKLRSEQDELVSIQDASAQEASKIVANVRDLDKTLATLIQEQSQLEQSLLRDKQSLADAEKTIRHELEPQVKSDRNALSEMMKQRAALFSQQFVIGQIDQLNTRRAALGVEPKRARGTGSDVSASPNAPSLRHFCDEVASILTEWRFPSVGVVEFSDRMDLVVNGEPRRTHGKGIRAILHSAFTVGLMQHCFKRDLKHTGVVLLDSPLTSYKEKDRGEVAEDIQRGFYEHLIKMPKYQQVIVFENKEPPVDLLAAMHQTHFTGNITVGRKGFIPPRKIAET